MKTIAYERFGGPDVLHIVEAPKPTPGADEILVRVHAVAVTPSDTAFRSGKPFLARLAAGPRKPRLKVLGDSLAGVVEAVGSDVTKFKAGDRVFGSAGPRLGAHAEYVVSKADGAIAKMPDAMSFAEGAGIADGGLTALPFLRDQGKIRAGHHVLINGAAGAIGTIAVQLAKHFGATVTGVSSGKNTDLVRSLGADHAIDYTREDFTQEDDAYDIVFDAVGKSSYRESRRALKPGGLYLTTVPGLGIALSMLRSVFIGGRKAKFAPMGLRKPTEKAKDLALFVELYENGSLKVIVDKAYPFDRFADAHAHVDGGHKRGVVILEPAIA